VVQVRGSNNGLVSRVQFGGDQIGCTAVNTKAPFRAAWQLVVSKHALIVTMKSDENAFVVSAVIDVYE
jgi:hypothetical protein